MKIAICLSGHMRNFEATVKSFQQNVASAECDVFIHTWDKLGYEHSWHGSDNGQVGLTKYSARSIMRGYSPKAIMIEPSFHWDIAKYGLNLQTCHENIPMMFYKIKKCNDLKNSHQGVSGEKYDLVVRTRPDLLHYGRIDYERLDPSFLHLPSFGFGHNDQLAVGSPAVMDSYCAAIDSFDEYVGQYAPETLGDNYRPELFLKWHLDRQNVSVRRLTARYSIVRMNRHARTTR